jgi:hypothetical protein
MSKIPSIGSTKKPTRAARTKPPRIPDRNEPPFIIVSKIMKKMRVTGWLANFLPANNKGPSNLKLHLFSVFAYQAKMMPI